MTAMELINDRSKMQSFLAAMSPRSISNAGRNIEMSSVHNANRGGALEATSITAAEQAKALIVQTNRQRAFAAPAADADRVSRALPSLDILSVIDAQRVAFEVHKDDIAGEGSPASAKSHKDDSDDYESPQHVLVRGHQRIDLSASSSPQRRPMNNGDDDAPGASDTLRSQTHRSQSPVKADRPESPSSGRGGENGDKKKDDGKPLKFLSQLSSRRVQQPAKPSACFLTPHRTEVEPTSNNPPVGHYRPKHTLTQPILGGGYIEPKPARHSPRRPHPSPAAHGNDVEQEAAAAPKIASPTSTLVGSPSKVTSPLKSPTAAAVSSRAKAREKLEASPPRAARPHPVFQSKAPRLAAPYPTDGADAWYWPRCEWRSDPSSNCRVNIDKHTPRKPLHQLSDNPDAYYTVSSPFGADVAARTADISLLTGREHYPVEKKFFYCKDVDLPSDPQALLDHVRPHIGSMLHMERQLPRPPFGPTETVDFSVDHREGASPKDTGSQRKRPLLVTDFGRQVPHPPLPLPGSTGAPELYDVTASLTVRSPPRPVIHPGSPGHLPLHEPSITEFSDPPTLEGVRPKGSRNVDFDKQPTRQPMLVNLHDLEYDSRFGLMSPRVTGNPMISATLPREKREKAFAHRLCAPDAGAYSYVLPASTGSNVHLDFSRLVAREDAACGRDKPSPKYIERHPRAPGPGAYDIK